MSVLIAFRTTDPLRVLLGTDSIVKSLDAGSGEVRTRYDAHKIRGVGAGRSHAG